MRFQTFAVVALLCVIVAIFPAGFGWVQHAQTGPSTVVVYVVPQNYQTEGNSGSQTWYVHIRRQNDWSGSCTLNYRTVNVTTQGPADYSPLSGSVSFGPGEGQISLPLEIVGDTVFELDERFRVEVSDLVGCVAETSFREVVIYDDDAPGSGASAVSFYRDGPEGQEGNGGITQFNFRIDRVGDLNSPCTFSYVTRDGTALAPEDYATRSGSYTFAPGQAQALIPVNVVADLFLEYDETFYMDITGTTGCVARNYYSVMAK